MALTSWKAFRFFDVSEVALGPDEKSVFVDQANITCVATGSDNVFLGSADGTVRILSSAFKIVRSFKAYENGASITQLKQVHGTSLLVSIAEDLSSEPVLKVWALDMIEKKSGIPRCQCTLSIHNGRKQFPISAFAALGDLSQLAVGFANGSVTIVRGDLIHDRGARQRTVFEGQEPITGIEFRQGHTTTLYIATTGRISTLVISGHGQGQPARTLEETGCSVGCITIDPTTQDIVVAREDGIYYYGLHGRGPVYAMDSAKQSISIFKDYIAVISPPQRRSSAARTGPLRALGLGQADDPFTLSNCTLLNPDLKFIAHQEVIRSQIRRVFMEWNQVFMLTQDGKILRYREKTFQQQLDLLFQRDLYVLAINLAQKTGVHVSQQNIIYRKYGDYLYQKQDYDTAMQQYLRAIDNTEPSQIIRKFLDAQRIHNLIDYLEELHDNHKATSDHTTLLLNCYAKLRDVDKLEEFIKSPDDLKFDLDTAIAMCRQGGYHDQAAHLARKHNEHDLVIDILVEDLKKYAEALAYVWRCVPEVAYFNLMKYAIVFLENCPEDATKLFIDYYTGQFRPKKDTVVVVPQTMATQQGSLARATTAVQNLAALLPLPYMNAREIVSSGQARDYSTVTQVVEEDMENEPPAEYDIPPPRTAFSAFVDHSDQLIDFLEACIGSDKLSEDDSSDLYTTLFEMYVQTANSKKNEDRLAWENKAKALIESKKIPIDTSSVLLLSHLSDFKDGTMLVREKRGLRFDIFRSYTSAKDTAGAIKALHKYGAQEPDLYSAALTYFTSTPQILDEADQELDVVLRKIDEDGLMAPLQVIQTLSSSGVATIGLIRRYLGSTIERERDEIASNRKLIDTYRADTDQKLKEMHELETRPTTFNATRCSACSAHLDLPTVHFLCKHSYHQRCLNVPDGTDTFAGISAGSANGAAAASAPVPASAPASRASLHGTENNLVECPICAPSNATLKAIRKAQEDSAGRHDLFRDALDHSRDKFGTISEWFGRGVMNSSVQARQVNG